MTLAASGEAGAAIRDALKALRKTPAAAQLAALLYGDSLPDGLGAVSPMWLAGNAEAAFAFVSEKPRALFHGAGVLQVLARRALE